jgi:ribonuclease HII
MTKKINTPAFISDFYEQDAWSQNRLVCGIDEAGRGCFAGPVVVAAAVLKPGATHKLLKDSKVLSEPQREEAFAWVIEHAQFAVSVGTPEDIEQYNILQATKRNMVQSFINLMEQEKTLLPQLKFLLIDAVNLTLPSQYHPATMQLDAFPYGESRSISIAAASIVAKVTRDRLMHQLHTLFPAFGFDAHKGYGTPLHQARLTTFGKSIVHRPSFLKKFEPTKTQQQLSIG